MLCCNVVMRVGCEWYQRSSGEVFVYREVGCILLHRVNVVVGFGFGVVGWVNGCWGLDRR